MKNTLIASISGIRGIFGAGLDPAVLVENAGAFGAWCRRQTTGSAPTVIVGRDARVTGELCQSIVMASLRSTGCDVIDAGLSTTPTVEMAVLKEQAAGGIVISASHNPAEWNALKLLNSKGEFLNETEGAAVRDSAAGRIWSSWDGIGKLGRADFLDYHIERILELPFIDAGVIGRRDFRIVVDGVNSVGGVAIPRLLKRLGVQPDRILELNCEPTGLFAHPAEPLPENLSETCRFVSETGADLGIVVDPDADRLALIQDGGLYFSEELTQVTAARFLWGVRRGAFATNLSSSRAIDDLASEFGMSVYRSAVGEINVVERMKETGAILGGEGNGGVILPDLHYGRDALAGVAMILQHLAETGETMQGLKRVLPDYSMAKLKTDIGDLDPDILLERMAERYAGERISLIDGVKIDFADGWVHMRKSNTEPIVRVYSEAGTPDAARALGERFLTELTG